MIVNTPDDITAAVLAELEGASDARFRQIMGAAVRHLHAFAREVQLTEAEFQQACAVVARLGQCSTASHNEVVLVAGSTGLSALVCLINNTSNNASDNASKNAGAERGTTANLLGPFWRADAPRTANGASIVRGPTPGLPLLVNAWVHDDQGRPVAGAEVDIWHSSTEGYYENQDASQPDMNLRGKFTTDAAGHIAFQSIKPAGYPIPVDGPVGDLLRAQGRHNMRPAHIHFLIHKSGFKTQFSQVYSSDDPHLTSDVQFGVTQRLVGHYVRHDGVTEPLPGVSGDWFSLEYHFVIEPGVAHWPRAPITGRAVGVRAPLAVLQPRKSRKPGDPS